MGKYVLKYNSDVKLECCCIMEREFVSIAIDEGERYLYVCCHNIEGESIKR